MLMTIAVGATKEGGKRIRSWLGRTSSHIDSDRLDFEVDISDEFSLLYRTSNGANGQGGDEKSGRVHCESIRKRLEIVVV